MVINYKPINMLIPWKRNAKKHPPEQVERVANSIREFGFVQPLVIDGENNVVIGHCRLLAAKKLKMDAVPCVVADTLTEEQLKALRLADNRVAESEWDYDLLNDELAGIFDIDMGAFGFDLTSDEPKEAVEDDYDPTPPKEPKAKRGEVYRLGRHRLMCGDSTDAADVARLMGDGKAQILFTSPPYSDMRDYGGDKDLSINYLANFIKAYRQYTDYQCVNLGLQRRNGEVNEYWNDYINKAKEAGYRLLAWNVWDKAAAGSVGMQKAFFPIRHEWIFVFGEDTHDFTFVFGVKPYGINPTWKKKEVKRQNEIKGRRQKDGSIKYSSAGDTSGTYKKMESVVRVHSEKGAIRSEHPATFPVGLPAEYIQAMTHEGETVIEPFSGAGTTIIACEQLNRACCAMELEPAYIDVAINRWEQFTGQKAEFISE